MEKRIISFAKKLLKSQECLKIFTELEKIYESESMYLAQINCLERIWHISKNHCLLKKIGDIFINKMRDRNMGFIAHCKYLEFTQPEFYERFSNNSEVLNIKLADKNIYIQPDFEILCDNYNTILDMIHLMFKLRNYKCILKLKKYLNEMKTLIINESAKYKAKDIKFAKDDIVQNEKRISKILSEDYSCNDLNLFAVDLDYENKFAHFNVINYYLSINNADIAKNYYNSVYCKYFIQKPQKDIYDICWIISGFYEKEREYYNSVLFQKYALQNYPKNFKK